MTKTETTNARTTKTTTTATATAPVEETNGNGDATATATAPSAHRQGGIVVNGQSPYFVPAGRYRGRIESAELKQSIKEGTPFYDCVCVILDDLVVQGRNVRNARLSWSGFLKQEGRSALRTIRSMVAAGCSFPDEDYENYTGLGTKDVELDVEEEEPFTLEPTEENPEPKTIYKCRVAWVNKLARGMVSKEIDASARATIGQSMKGLIKMAKSGPGADDPNDGIPMKLDPKTGKMVKMF